MPVTNTGTGRIAGRVGTSYFESVFIRCHPLSVPDRSRELKIRQTELADIPR
jgi:hypothetical protein